MTMRIVNKLLITCLCCVISAHAMAAIHSAAFFYGEHPPLDLLHAYDAVIVSPDANINPMTDSLPSSQLYAYVSVGEVDRSANYFKKIPATWLIGKNTAWQSQVINQTEPLWPPFFIEQIIKPLWDKGYRGFFFDTLDSYQLAVADPTKQAAQLASIRQLIQRVKKEYPDANIILNRGFELLPDIKDLIAGVAAESLYLGWDQAKKEYKPISNADTSYLLNQLNQVKKLGIPAIVIDYAPPNMRADAYADAKRIQQLGFIPWVSDGLLNTVGVGAVTPIKRKLFVVYSKEDDTTLFDPTAFVVQGLPMEHLGYVPDYHDIDQPLPNRMVTDFYAGIIVNAEAKNQTTRHTLHQWLVDQIHRKIPIVFMDSFVFDTTQKNFAPFGIHLQKIDAYTNEQLKIAYKDPDIIGFELQPNINRYEVLPITVKNAIVSLQLINQDQQRHDMIAITPWGGYAIAPYTVVTLPNSQSLWVLDPIKWVPRALHAEPFPIPDVTTENGRRLMIVHIDGDGFSTKAEWKNGQISAIELKNRILEHFRIPTSVSVITADIAPNGLYPNSSKEFIKIAKSIFSLPWVEVASHTFSHPFDWIKVTKYPKSGKYNLPVPGYIFSSEAEVTGSIDFINKNLVPPGKFCKILFWSGYAEADEKSLALTYKDHVYNYNGGDTNPTYSMPSMTRVGPFGRKLGPYFQVYAAISNEEFYTNSWLGPFYGFQRVIETLQLTESPYRLKPIDLYFHFYSVSKKASLDALYKAYHWALAQPVMNIFASEYVQKVLDFNQTSIARIENGWQIKNNGALREFRMPLSMGYPDLERSKNLVGFNQYQNEYYLHTGPLAESTIYFSKKPSSLVYLVSANGRVEKFNRTENGLVLRLRGYMPLTLELGNMEHCKVMQKGRLLSGVTKPNHVLALNLQVEDSDDLQISCTLH